MNALDLIPSQPLTHTTILSTIVKLEANFGVTYSPEKIKLLYETLRDDGWSDERFRRVADWLIRNQKYPNWSIADWYKCEIKVYPYEWMLKEIDKNGQGARASMDCFILEDGKTVVYRYRDGQELPLKRFNKEHFGTPKEVINVKY